jgi:hypothetical protein
MANGRAFFQVGNQVLIFVFLAHQADIGRAVTVRDSEFRFTTDRPRRRPTAAVNGARAHLQWCARFAVTVERDKQSFADGE